MLVPHPTLWDWDLWQSSSSCRFLMHLASCLIFASLDDVNSVVWYGGGGVRRELERGRGEEREGRD